LVYNWFTFDLPSLEKWSPQSDSNNDPILTMNALLSKNFALLRQASRLRCLHISYALLLDVRFPCIARFLIRMLCRQSTNMKDEVSGTDSMKCHNKEKDIFFVDVLFFIGALNRIRTDDPILTMDVLCRLSYEGKYFGRLASYTFGAGEGNRTLAVSLGS
jgi:hypothetical protein